MESENCRILLTGASSGIGKILCQELASRKGNRILAIARHIEEIPRVPGTVFPFQADISRNADIDRCFAYAHENWGGIDILIANAGFAYCGPLFQRTGKTGPENESANETGTGFEAGNNPDETLEPVFEKAEKIFATNVLSQIYALERFLSMPGFSSRKRCFISILSAVAMVPLPYYALYCSSKSALDSFFRTFEYEKPENLQLLRIYPVATRTAFFQKAFQVSRPPLPFLRQKPETVAKAVLKALEKGERVAYPSSLFRIAYPFMRAFPFLTRLYSRHEKKKLEAFFNERLPNPFPASPVPPSRKPLSGKDAGHTSEKKQSSNENR